MKTFILAMALFASDGSKTELPVELWHFDSLAQCTLSADHLNAGQRATTRSYTCIESRRPVQIAANTK